MAISNMNRTITFRLPAAEFDEIRNLCRERGVRSVSELARCALRNVLEEDGTGLSASVDDKLRHMDSRIKVLDRALERLAQIVEESKAERTR
jgi:Arc/MetJ-type ribon-helix-helix transcriptional regulator